MAMPRRLVFAIPGDVDTRSGGYGYDRRIIGELRTLGWQVEHLELPAGFPQPSAAELAETARQLAAVEDNSLVMIDGLAFGCMPKIAEAEADRLALIALVHHPLALETGLTESRAARLKASEVQALKSASGVVVTSLATARTLEEAFEVATDRIHVAIPGTEPAKAARGSEESGTGPMIVAVGSLTPRKDHALLIAALEKLKNRPFHCRIIGSDTMDPETTASLRQQVDRAGLGDRVELTGAIDDLANDYDRADIFALASRYEGYGMAFAEAMARGIPIVACRGGAIPDVVPLTAGLLVEPCDLDGFSRALAALIDDRELRQRYAAGSLAAGRRLPGWQATAAGLSDYLEMFR